MIRLLLALHPRSWRVRYGQELRALLEVTPLTAAIVLDVIRNAIWQHVRAHRVVLRVVAAVSASMVVEAFAVRAQVADNVLWPPSTLLRTLTLAVLLLPWLPVARDLMRALRRRRPPVTQDA